MLVITPFTVGYMYVYVANSMLPVSSFVLALYLSACNASGELLAAYTIVKLLAYSKRHSIHKIPMDCSKLHMMHFVMFLLSIGRSEHQQHSHRLNHCWYMVQ